MESTSGIASLIIKATAFAANKHRNQRRKDAEASPYINHPIALADVLANEGRVEDHRASPETPTRNADQVGHGLVIGIARPGSASEIRGGMFG